MTSMEVLRTVRNEVAILLDEIDKKIKAQGIREFQEYKRALTDPDMVSIEDVPRTTAIEHIVNNADGPLRPIEIWKALRDHGRRDPKAEVGVSVNDLYHKGRIDKRGRGQYVRRTDLS